MPFTLAHPVAVIPFARAIGRRAPLSAMVIGSMVPDAEHLLGGFTREIGHTVAGLAIFSLPAGLAIYVIYEYLMREPLVALMPARLARRLQLLAAPRRIADLRTLLIVSAAIVFGAATHLLLDSFTHYGGWFVQRSPFLQSVAIEEGAVQLVWYKVLQYVSVPVGCGIILLMFIRWYRHAPARTIAQELFIPAIRRHLILGFIVGATIAASIFIMATQIEHTGRPLYAQVALVRGALAGMSTALFTLLAYCIAFRLFGSAIRGEHARAHGTTSGKGHSRADIDHTTLVSDGD